MPRCPIAVRLPAVRRGRPQPEARPAVPAGADRPRQRSDAHGDMVVFVFGGTLGDGLGGDWLALIAFLVMMTFAFIWLSVAFGLASKSVESASSVGMPLVLLPFLGS